MERFDDVCNEPPAFTVKNLTLNGSDLIAMGMQPGPGIRRVLETLLDEVQEERLENEHAALRARAAELLSEE